MRLLLPLPFLLALGCASTSTSSLAQPDNNAVGLYDQLVEASNMATNSARRAAPGQPHLAENIRSTFTRPLRCLKLLTTYHEQTLATLSGSQGTAATCRELGNALEALLEGMSDESMPDEAYMEPALRDRLITEVVDSESTSAAWKLCTLFSGRVEEIVDQEMTHLHTNLGLLSLELLRAVESTDATENAYLSGLQKKRAALREAVLQDMEVGLPTEWDPAKDLVAIEALLKTAENEGQVRMSRRSEVEQQFDALARDVDAIRRALSKG